MKRLLIGHVVVALTLPSIAQGQVFTLVSQNAYVYALAADDGFPGGPPFYEFSSTELTPHNIVGSVGSGVGSLTTSFTAGAATGSITAFGRGDGYHTIQQYDGLGLANVALTFSLPAPTVMTLSGRHRWARGGSSIAAFSLVGPGGAVPIVDTVLFSDLPYHYDATHSFSGVLDAGTYTFSGRALGSAYWLALPRNGFGEFSVSMNFAEVPSPSVVAAGAVIGLATIHRRRR